MLEEIQQNKFKIIPNFLDQKSLDGLNKRFKESLEHCRASFDVGTIVGRSYNISNFLPAINILCNKNHFISELIEDDVLPTYAFIRRYCNGSSLKSHTDRKSCEISLTVHLDADSPWEFKLVNDGKVVSITQNPGDAILYLGCEIPHFRETYNGNYYDQMFLHYVKTWGNNSEHFFDLNSIRMETHEIIMKQMNKKRD